MTGRDNPRSWTRSRIHDLLAGVGGRVPFVKAERVDANELESTGGTFVKAILEASKTGIAAGQWTKIVDTELVDTLGEFNSNFRFSPDETGWYRVRATARIAPGADGDLVEMKLQDVTNGNTVLGLDGLEVGGATNFTFLQGDVSEELYKSNNYEIQVRDRNSTFDIESFGSQTSLTITDEIIHP